jgi:hypothetical protein
LTSRASSEIADTEAKRLSFDPASGVALPLDGGSTLGSADKPGLPSWVVPVAIVAAVVIIAAILFAIVLRSRAKPEEAPSECEDLRERHDETFSTTQWSHGQSTWGVPYSTVGMLPDEMDSLAPDAP